jgi:hypothetical protein
LVAEKADLFRRIRDQPQIRGGSRLESKRPVRAIGPFTHTRSSDLKTEHVDGNIAFILVDHDVRSVGYGQPPEWDGHGDHSN